MYVDFNEMGIWYYTVESSCIPFFYAKILSLESLITALVEMPIAIETDQAKAQHYELPTSFFKLVLGENLKYRYFSPIYFSSPLQTLCLLFTGFFWKLVQLLLLRRQVEHIRGR